MSRFSVISKLVRHSAFSAFISKNFPVIPVNVEISPSAACNAACPECLYIKKGYSRSGFMDTALLIKILEELDFLGVKAVTWSGGGEPTLHPDFAKVILKCGKMSQGLFTNAKAAPEYNPLWFDWIRVTLTENGENAPIENIKKLRSCPTLGICINVKNDDREAIERALKIGEDVGADYVQARPVLNVDGKTTDISIPKIDHPLFVMADYKFKDCGKRHEYSRCYGYHFVPFIWENGQVDACGYMRHNSDYALGDLQTESFMDILHKVPRCLPVSSDCQVCCKNHEINKFINGILESEDVNFV